MNTIQRELHVKYETLEDIQTCLQQGNRISCTVVATKFELSTIWINAKPHIGMNSLSLHGATVIYRGSEVISSFYEELRERSHIFRTVEEIYDLGSAISLPIRVRVDIRVTNKDRRNILRRLL